MNSYKYFIRFSDGLNRNSESYHEDWFEASSREQATMMAKAYASYMENHNSLICTEIKLIDAIEVRV